MNTVVEELKPGNFYTVFGKDHSYIGSLHEHEEIGSSMYVRKETIRCRDWYVFANVFHDDILMRVRVPAHNCSVADSRVSADTLVSKIIVSDRHDDIRVSGVSNFIDAAHRIVADKKCENLDAVKQQLVSVIKRCYQEDHSRH